MPNLSTIRQAQQLLAVEGLLERLGVFVAALSAPPAAETLLSRRATQHSTLAAPTALEKAGVRRTTRI